MSEPEPSESSPAPPSDPARTPGTRTPRRVQWATAIDEAADEDEDDGDHHCLDQAGLDVCNFSLPLLFRSQFSFFTACCLSIAHSCPRTSSSLKFRLATSDSDGLGSHPTAQAATIIYTLLCGVVPARFSQTPFIWD